MNDQIDPRDRALQSRLDAGESTSDDSDARAYSALYSGLSSSTAKLSTSFAYEAMVRAWRHRRRLDARNPLISLLLCTGAMAAGMASLYAVSSFGFAPKSDWHSLRMIFDALSPVRYAAAGILLVAIMDAMLSRHRTR